jgi:hypothetical protein
VECSEADVADLTQPATTRRSGLRFNFAIGAPGDRVEWLVFGEQIDEGTAAIGLKGDGGIR